MNSAQVRNIVAVFANNRTWPTLFLGLVVASFPSTLHAQNASLSGTITDQSGALMAGVEVTVTSEDRGVATTVITNGAGVYVVPSLVPGAYRLSVEKRGFQEIVVRGIALNVEDKVSRNFTMRVGTSSEVVQVTANTFNINTSDGATSTVVNRQFVENMPLNGRSFQALLTLAPGVVQVPTYQGLTGTSGEITVNGQRTEANYFTVDGVSANTGTAPTASLEGGLAGNIPGETVLGTTQSIVSIDALQEFRATTSTYSAEYGRTPGGQFSFSTRPGTNDWHGSLFDYFRNDIFDANNWFNNAANPQIPRQAERQNDFGGVLGGPLVVPGLYDGKDKTFFFFSYEGLRLTIPQPFQQYSVPDLTLRQQVPAALQPAMNAFPLPNGGEDGLNDGLAFYNLAYSAPSDLDNLGVRMDHSFNNRFKIFGRYASTSSSAWTYGQNPGFKASQSSDIHSLTLGANNLVTTTQANEFRLNITQNDLYLRTSSTALGGATPFDISGLPLPAGQSPANVSVFFNACFGGCPSWSITQNSNEQKQFNVTDGYSWTHGAHQFRFGGDWRRLTTYVKPITFSEQVYFASQGQLLSNTSTYVATNSYIATPVEPVYHNLSFYAQDDWRLTSLLSVSLGLRWDINPAPGNLDGPEPYTLNQVTNLATASLAPQGTPLWKSDWLGLAPRIGVAYQLRGPSDHETVVRTGFGVFYDMGNTQGSIGFQSVGYQSANFLPGAAFPLSSAAATLPPPSTASPYNDVVAAFDPNLRLPYTMQWNLALEQALGTQQALTINYVGSVGRRLLTQFVLYPPDNPNFSSGNGLILTQNRASSSYNALQLKYERRLSHGLQVLGSYTWSHSIDNASSNFQLAELLRSSSDFDIRHNFQMAITYNVPGGYKDRFASALLEHWGLDTRVTARSALPLDVIGSLSLDPATGRLEYYHPNLVQGQPVYLYGSQYPGGRILNYAAFTPAPQGIDGDTGRNFARQFDATQIDLALRRDFPLREQLHLQFRAEAFNLLNHPSFGSIYNALPYGPSQFGYAYATLNNSLGGLNSLYQIGGPRSLQLSLKLAF